MYSVLYSQLALKDLKKLDGHTRRFILAWIGKNLEGCKDPRQFGKGLRENRASQWRYRLGDYRLLVEINEDKIIILILTVGHRRDIYNK